MFEGDSADMCAGKFSLVSMGGRAEGLGAQTRKRGPPLALAEICYLFLFLLRSLQIMEQFGLLGNKTEPAREGTTLTL